MLETKRHWNFQVCIQFHTVFLISETGIYLTVKAATPTASVTENWKQWLESIYLSHDLCPPSW